MAAITVRNLSPETHRALKARAKRNARSAEAEVRAILDAAVQDPERVRLGSLIHEIGLDAGVEDFHVDRDRSDREPIDLS